MTLHPLTSKADELEISRTERVKSAPVLSVPFATQSYGTSNIRRYLHCDIADDGLNKKPPSARGGAVIENWGEHPLLAYTA